MLCELLKPVRHFSARVFPVLNGKKVRKVNFKGLFLPLLNAVSLSDKVHSATPQPV